MSDILISQQLSDLWHTSIILSDHFLYQQALLIFPVVWIFWYILAGYVNLFTYPITWPISKLYIFPLVWSPNITAICILSTSLIQQFELGHSTWVSCFVCSPAGVSDPATGDAGVFPAGVRGEAEYPAWPVSARHGHLCCARLHGRETERGHPAHVRTSPLVLAVGELMWWCWSETRLGNFGRGVGGSGLSQVVWTVRFLS